jgi:hypothetical protein
MRDKVPPGSFKVITVSEPAYLTMRGLEAAAALVERAYTGDELMTAERQLSLMRANLAAYISKLEAVAIQGGAEIEQNITLRFN